MRPPLGLALLGAGVDEVVEDRAVLGELERRLGVVVTPVGVELLTEVGTLVAREAAADAPHTGELEVGPGPGSGSGLGPVARARARVRVRVLGSGSGF